MSTGRLPSVDGGIQPTVVDAKGDLIVATAADTVSRLAVGSNDQVLTADSSTSTGLKWATAATPSTAANWTLVNSGGTLLTGSTTTVSGISGADKIMVLVGAPSTGYSTDSTQDVYIRLNTDTGNNYYNFGAQLDYPATYGANNMQSTQVGGATSGIFIGRPNAASSYGGAYCLISGCNTSGVKVFNASGSFQYQGSSGTGSTYILGGYYNSSSVITSVSVFTSFSTNFDAGRVYVYTSA